MKTIFGKTLSKPASSWGTSGATQQADPWGVPQQQPASWGAQSAPQQQAPDSWGYTPPDHTTNRPAKA